MAAPLLMTLRSCTQKASPMAPGKISLEVRPSSACLERCALRRTRVWLTRK